MKLNKQPNLENLSTEELIELALNEPDEDAAWEAVVVLHGRGTAEVLDQARALSCSEDPDERSLGADILGQLGRRVGVEKHSFPRESIDALLEMLEHEEEDDVTAAVLTGLSWFDDPRIVLSVVHLAKHSDPDVRHALTLVLAGSEDPTAIRMLIDLSADKVDEVRNWATFALGTQLELDTPPIRDALAKRLQDSDEEIRGEALVGLARRKDHRAIPALKRELLAEQVHELFVDAAELTADPQLYESLQRLTTLQGSGEHLERAIAACKPADAGQ